MKNVLIISSLPRKKGNSQLLCEPMARILKMEPRILHGSHEIVRRIFVILVI